MNVNGTWFVILYTADPTHGVMDVIVDGVRVAAINQVASSTQYQQSWKSDAFSESTHIVILRHVQGGKVDFDGLFIEPALPDPLPEVPTETATATEVAPTSTPIPPTPTVPAPASGAYYVATNGSDSNPGTLEKPWKTLGYASKQLQAGNTLYIRGGTYREVTSWYADGRSDAPITIRSYPGETAVIDGYDTIPEPGNGTWLMAIKADWYIVQGLEVKHSYGNGGIIATGTHVTIRNNYVHHNWQTGITITGDYGLAEGNRVWYNSMGNENWSLTRGGWSTGITCARYPTNCTIRGNTVWETWGQGISTYEAYNTTIEDNISYNNQQNIYISDTKYTLVQRNLVYCTPNNPIGSYTLQNGILVGDEKMNPPSSDNTFINNIVIGCDRNLAAGTAVSTNNLYANNTFVNSGGNASERANVLIYVKSTCTNCRFVNNLILQETNNPIALGGGVSNGWTFSNNLWSEMPPTNFRGSNDIIADPKLAKTGSMYGADWYRLLSGSPAIDMGKLINVITKDFTGYGRVGTLDIGAFEFH
jgi:parallel beta-helix repeat protein